MADTNNKGFDSRDPDQQREIGSKGGKAGHEKGNTNEIDAESGSESGGNQ